MLSIKDLHVSVEDKAILRGLSLDVRPGEVHAIMGPNGSGKSTLSATLAGREDYEVTGGTVEFKGKDLLALSPEDRAGEGIFMAFQYPVEIPGVSNQFFLQTALNAVRSYRGQETLDRFDFQDLMEEKIALLKMPEDLLTRSVNVGFSGGEKKRNDILQMAVLEPELCILDESDSGLDIDALKVVADGVNSLRDGKRSFIIVTLLRTGLPTRKHENWKYTPLEGLTNSQFVSIAGEISPQQRDALALTLDAVRLVFVDGRYVSALSDATEGSGYEVSINDDRQGVPDAIQAEVFLHLTESLAQSVTHIAVKRGQRPAKPLLLMHITQGVAGEEVNTAHYRHHLDLAEGAEATVIEHFVSLNDARHFTGARFTINVAANAHLQHIKLAFENPVSHHFAHNDLLLADDATAFSHSFLLGGAVLRHNTSTQLNGENSTLRINSLAMPVKNEVCDTRTWLEHNKGFCNSRQLHKTIVSDKGRAVFNGLINVAQHAIKTDGQMTNNNLLMGKLAEVDTKPQLEIYADDVKCSHGATVGRIDDEQMFYLRSRGINQQDAQQMIIYAFAAELTEALRDEGLKQQVLARIGQRLPGGAR
ncbi:Fe-S cluster assembly protein SufD [Escherichia coli]|nr:Fe-S cluster assembly protein SufD [Escherichia coli]